MPLKGGPVTIVGGDLKDFNLGLLTSQVPEIVFTPSGPGVSGTNIFASEPIVAVPNSAGHFSVALQPTEGLIPDVWYEVSIRWFPRGSGQNYASLDLLHSKVLVPDTTTPLYLPDLLNISAGGASGLIWCGPTAPPNPSRGTKWLNTITGDLMEWS